MPPPPFPAPAPCTPAHTCASSPAPQRAVLLMCRHHAPSAWQSHMRTHMLAPSPSTAQHPWVLSPGDRAATRGGKQSRHPPTHPHPKSCHPPPVSTGTSWRHSPLHAHSAPSGLPCTRGRVRICSTPTVGKGKGKKTPRFSRERGVGGEREKERENDRLQSPLSA